ncbi:hypothetical protein TCAL_01496 [Tigriopus californicus]|uniref:CUB domain-containing protein n=1 Tax=Tigriopus californicus TaxID=6832 RepID=A0A553N8B1_TIGCA|nr:hypothetical protein TCAL_01496 [Tigriopus californicus]
MGYRGSNLAVCFILFIALPLLSILIEARKSKLIQSNKAVSDRTGKLFSLFNVVKFENEACVTQSDQTMRGTCFSQATCQEKGGRADGNCASDICQVRLDFDTTVLRTDPGLAGMCGGAGDSLQVGSPFSPSRFAFPPTVCGTLTGQHSFCQFQLYETPGVPDAFSVSENGNGQAQVQICKNRNFVTVPSMAINPNGIRGFSDYRCGMTFSSQSGDTTPGALLSTRVTPFRVQVHTLKADDGNQVTFANLKGFSLDYNQIPC